jgi:geranylgeranyl reductase family protein
MFEVLLIFMEQIEDVAIVGGGPAGAYCAFELAKKGIYATIFDDSHPREKPCGGGISPLVIKKFPFVERFHSKGNISAGFKIISPKNREVVAREGGFNVSRRYFDEGILKMATENRAKLIRERVTDVEKKQNFWKIKTNRRIVSTKIIVGADGVSSLVRRKTIGPIPRENLGLGYGYFVTGVEREYTTMKFLDEIPGYIWIFPRDNHSSIGISSELRYGNRLKKLLDDFIRSYCPQIRVISRFAAMLPLAKNPDFFMLPCAGVDWVLVGDAAGHVDPITGEGILYALWSGKLAAEVIKRNELKSYDRLWRKEYGNSLRENCARRDMFYNPLMIELRLFWLLETRPILGRHAK